MPFLSEEQKKYEHESDEAILAVAIRNPRLFSLLVFRYQGPFIAKAQSILKSREDAEEVTIDAFAKIYQYASRFQPEAGASFKSWGYKILVNTALTRYQVMKRGRGMVADVDPEWYEGMADTEMRQFEKEEISELVVSVLARMPDSMRRILALYFMEGIPQHEIAALEGTSVGAIKTRMHRAKQEFREVLASMK